MSEAVPDIRVKRIYDPPDRKDRARVLVDRLWPRGVGKEAAKLTLWLKDIAPSAELRQSFGHDPARFAEFSLRYRAELSANKDAVGQMDDLMKAGPVTLLYAARDTEHNEARVLADYLEGSRARRIRAHLIGDSRMDHEFRSAEERRAASSRSRRRRPASTKR